MKSKYLVHIYSFQFKSNRTKEEEEEKKEMVVALYLYPVLHPESQSGSQSPSFLPQKVDGPKRALKELGVMQGH